MRLLMLAVLLFFVGCSSGIQYPEGGYDYPKQVEAKDTNFYYYPVKNSLPRLDSFRYGSDYLFFKNFDEPNFSLRPLKQDVFRFVYSAFASKSYIILLRRNNIIIKSGYPGSFYDDNKSALNETEKLHLQILTSHYPLDAPQTNLYRKRYLDSLVKLFPQLLDPNYFQQLELKTIIRNNKTYETKVIPISTIAFDSLVNRINASGYWKLPFHINCYPDAYPTDGYNFMLEANTKGNYNIVTVDGCSPGDTTKFAKACQQLIEFVKLEKEITCYHDYKKINETSSPFIIKDVQLEQIKPEAHKKKRRLTSK